MMVTGFFSNCPNQCPVTRYYINDVIDRNGDHWCYTPGTCANNYTNYFAIDNTGNLTILNTTKTTEPLMLYIYACSDLICSIRTRNVVNLTVYPFFSYNPNIAPVYSGIVGYKLPTKELYIGFNYNSTPYTLPKTYDFEGNNVYTDIYLRNERLFTFYDNTTKAFKFYNRTILPRWIGNYTTTVTLGDDNWLGPK
jgi:hypothetical protein